MTTFTYLTREEISALTIGKRIRYCRRVRMYKIQNQLCDVCKKHIDIFKCRELREKPSKHFNLVCASCKKLLCALERKLSKLQKQYSSTILYLKRKKMYHKALLRLNRMKDNIAQVY